ncbi:MAG: VanZ family protein, partial [Planctomycetota bacterium]
MNADASDRVERSWALRGRAQTAAAVVVAGYAVLLFVGSHWPGLSLLAQRQRPWVSLDKFAHVVGYGGLAALVLLSGVGGVIGRKLRLGGGAMAGLVGTVLMCAAYALVDELTQPLVGRMLTGWDLLADAVGITLGLTGVAWARRWWRLEFGHRVDTRCSGEGDETRTDTSGGGGGFVGHAALVSGLTMVSRLTGLVRDAVLLAMFGASQTMSAFFFGFMVPNLFRRLFGEGALTAAFLPRYRRLLDDDPALAARYAKTCGWSAVGIVTALVLVGELVLLFAWWWAGDSEKATLALSLTALMLPYAPLICGVAFWSAVLQARGRFGPGAIAPVLLNLGMIVASALSTALFVSGEARATFVAVCVLVCGVMQVVLIGAAVRGGGG